MSTRELLFLWASFIKIQFSVLVLYKADIIIISLNVTHSRHDIVKNLLILALSNNLNNNCSLTCLDEGKKNKYFLRVQFVIRQNFGVSVLPSAEFELSLKYIYIKVLELLNGIVQFSPRNEHFNFLVRIKFLNLFLYLNKNWNIYWSEQSFTDFTGQRTGAHRENWSIVACKW
jgi:hypothetical protein